MKVLEQHHDLEEVRARWSLYEAKRRPSAAGPLHE